uniref:Leucine-rich repeat domain-containing protein n=1 Tax=Macrostomum lignano TaxID=282301 RepID=A0A1I8HUZ8_9PLAT
MLFTSLPPGLFQGSQSIAELILQRCHEYTSQTPALLVDTPRLRLLKLIEVGLNGEQLDNLLKSAPTRMMQTLEVIMTLYPPLRLSGATLSAFSLTSLSLSNNGITDFAFLPSVGAAEVTLSYNRAPLGRIELETSSIQPNRRVTLLRLEHSGLNEIPSFLSVVFPELAELNLASNIIQQLEPSRLANLSRLVRLDLSGNQIQTLSDWRRLQPLLSAILYRDRQSGHVSLKLRFP